MGNHLQLPMVIVVQSFIPSYCREYDLPGKLKHPIPAVKSNSCLNNRLNVQDVSKTPVGPRKCIFGPTSINDQRTNLSVYINGIFIEGLLETAANVGIITPQFWHPY